MNAARREDEASNVALGNNGTFTYDPPEPAKEITSTYKLTTKTGRGGGGDGTGNVEPGCNRNSETS
jgi:hypothetical protein